MAQCGHCRSLDVYPCPANCVFRNAYRHHNQQQSVRPFQTVQNRYNYNYLAEEFANQIDEAGQKEFARCLSKECALWKQFPLGGPVYLLDSRTIELSFARDRHNKKAAEGAQLEAMVAAGYEALLAAGDALVGFQRDIQNFNQQLLDMRNQQEAMMKTCEKARYDCEVAWNNVVTKPVEAEVEYARKVAVLQQRRDAALQQLGDGGAPAGR